MTHMIDPQSQQEVIDKFLRICRVQEHPPKTTIVKPGDLANSLYYIVEGSLSISMKGPDGRHYIIANPGAGDFIGEMGMFIKTQYREVYIESRTTATLAKISYTLLWDSLQNELRDHAIHFLQMIGTNLSIRLLKSDRKIFNLTSQDVLGRVTHALRELCREPSATPHPRGIKIKVSRSELSGMAGCSRERASKALTTLKEKGLIISEGRSIVVLSDQKAADLPD
jgi:CRP/FNR family transcriptional regulator, cyclic AMP receptor protein